MDLSSSEDDDDLPTVPPPAVSVYRPPARNPPSSVAVKPGSESLEVEVCSVGDGEVAAAAAADSGSDESGGGDGVVDISSGESEGEIEEVPVMKSERELTIAKAVSSGGKDVSQAAARYFMMGNVVCNYCGVKGHLSFSCPEEAEAKRCFLCGKPGHESHVRI